jgi:periplasmic copper chaperone A
MRAPLLPVLAGGLLVAVGAAGLVRAAVPQASASDGGGSGSGTGAAPIVVTAAYVHPPVPPGDTAAAYFTVYNNTNRDDRLIAVATGAGATAILHTVVNSTMSAAADGAVIPARGSLVLSTGRAHVMIEQLFGPLRPGQTVNLDLTFATAGSITVTAPVLALGAPAPTGPSAPTGSSAPTVPSVPSTGVTK